MESHHDSDSENGTPSGSPTSGASPKRGHVDASGKKNAVQEEVRQGSVDRPAGAGTKASPQSAGTEDFEPFFKDMFL